MHLKQKKHQRYSKIIAHWTKERNRYWSNVFPFLVSKLQHCYEIKRDCENGVALRKDQSDYGEAECWEEDDFDWEFKNGQGVRRNQGFIDGDSQLSQMIVRTIRIGLDYHIFESTINLFKNGI